MIISYCIPGKSPDRHRLEKSKQRRNLKLLRNILKATSNKSTYYC